MSDPSSVAPPSHLASVRYYVTAINGRRRLYFVAGPYARHEDALARVSSARELGYQQDPWSWFLAWGTTGLDLERPTPLGPEWVPPPVPTAT